MTDAQQQESIRLCEEIDTLCRSHSEQISFCALVDVLSEFVYDSLETTPGDMMQNALGLVVPCFARMMQATCAARGRPASQGSINWKQVWKTLADVALEQPRESDNPRKDWT